MKSAFVAIIGRPSAGKSSLLNRLCGGKISIVSPVPQTTRNKVRGILTEDRGQLVFVDTPGYHHSERKFNLYMKEQVTGALEEVDMVLYVIDTTRPIGTEERDILSLLSQFGGSIVVALNKADLPSAGSAAEAVALLSPGVDSGRILKTSAMTGEGLDQLKDALFDAAPEGEALYPEEYYTDQDPEFRAAEIIREKAFQRTREEVPHSLYVEIADMEQREDHIWIRAFLTVERDSQKGILIGRGGAMIREIRLEAQSELSEIFPTRVHLDLRVKVDPRWRRNDAFLRRLIG